MNLYFKKVNGELVHISEFNNPSEFTAQMYVEDAPSLMPVLREMSNFMSDCLIFKQINEPVVMSTNMVEFTIGFVSQYFIFTRGKLD